MVNPTPQDTEHLSLAQQIRAMFVDVEKEAERELQTPHDVSGSDIIVKKHFDGLVITGFVLVALFLAGAIALIALH